MTTTTAPARRLHNHRLRTVLGTVAAAAVTWTVLREVGDVDLAVTSPSPSTVGLPAVVATALLVGLAGWGLLVALERWTSRPVRTWRIIAAIGFVLSLTGPIGSAATLAAAGGLITLHVVVGAALFTGLTRRC